jgi:AcrR family transcriptional regulator
LRLYPDLRENPNTFSKIIQIMTNDVDLPKLAAPEVLGDEARGQQAATEGAMQHRAPAASKTRARAATKRLQDKPLALTPPSSPVDAPASPARRRRSNRRSEQTIDNIFEATEKVLLESGAERISILEVCETAGISRGTFYRYFASQDELLEGYSRYKRENFHKTAMELLETYPDPEQRFLVLINYLSDYLKAGSPRRMIIVAPEFALRFFKRIFHDSAIRFQVLLAPLFDVWDERLGVKLDRELVCDLIIRFVMSEQVLDSEFDRSEMPRRIGRLVDGLRFGGVTRSRR